MTYPWCVAKHYVVTAVEPSLDQANFPMTANRNDQAQVKYIIQPCLVIH